MMNITVCDPSESQGEDFSTISYHSSGIKHLGWEYFVRCEIKLKFTVERAYI